jgi:hypothetical protein
LCGLIVCCASSRKEEEEEEEEPQIARSSLVELICQREGRVEEEASSCKQASRQAGKQAGRGLTLKLLEILL